MTGRAGWVVQVGPPVMDPSRPHCSRPAILGRRIAAKVAPSSPLDRGVVGARRLPCKVTLLLVDVTRTLRRGGRVPAKVWHARVDVERPTVGSHTSVLHALAIPAWTETLVGPKRLSVLAARCPKTILFGVV